MMFAHNFISARLRPYRSQTPRHTAPIDDFLCKSHHLLPAPELGTPSNAATTFSCFEREKVKLYTLYSPFYGLHCPACTNSPPLRVSDRKLPYDLGAKKARQSIHPSLVLLWSSSSARYIKLQTDVNPPILAPHKPHTHTQKRVENPHPHHKDISIILMAEGLARWGLI